MSSAAQSATGGNQDRNWERYVERCAREEANALANLYGESSFLVYSIAMRVLSNRADAEEVTLDVYTQVWRTASTYDSARGNVTAWLVTIARSRALDRVRARALRAGLEYSLDSSSHHRTQTADPEMQTAWSQKRGRIAAAMESLTANQKIAIQLAFFSDLSHSELAAQLGVPLGTAKTRIRLGMSKLREELGALEVSRKA